MKKVASSDIQNYIEALEGLVEENAGKVEKTNEEVVKLLVKAMADEFLAWYQYWVCKNLSRGAGKFDADPEFSAHADEEMGHADQLIQRIKELGGKPIFNPQEWQVLGNPWTEVNNASVKEQLAITIQAEKDAIEFYKKIINYTRGFDESTHKMARGILADEEEHLYDLTMLLESVSNE